MIVIATRSADETLRRDMPGQAHRGAGHERGASLGPSNSMDIEAWRVIVGFGSVPIALSIGCCLLIWFCS